MATSFDDIYAQFENRATDADVSSYDNLYYYQMYQSLKYAIAEFKKGCYKDLNDRVNFSQNIYQFTGDGNTKDFVLNPIPSESTFYISINGTQTTSYTFLVDTISFFTAPALNDEIYIGCYDIGQFNETLNDEEISILADGLKVNLVSKNLYTTKQLSQMIYGNSIGMNSQANHNKTNRDIDEYMYKRWKQRMVDYTYYNDPDDLTGLMGDIYNG